MIPELCLVRGGGDLATGVVWRLTRAGWPVVVTELASPLTIRRTVAVSTAVTEGRVDVQGMVARLAPSADVAVEIARSGEVGVLVADGLPAVGADVVVDARLAKSPLDTTITDAPLVIGIGPGFTAGVDCHAVVESLRGHDLGRAIWEGSAAADTGTPGEVGGRTTDRVVRAPAAGEVRWVVEIGDVVATGVVLGEVAGHELRAPFDGVVRGLILGGALVTAGQKIGDVDPRADPRACHEISDKALAVAGGVLEAVLAWPGAEAAPGPR